MEAPPLTSPLSREVSQILASACIPSLTQDGGEEVGLRGETPIMTFLVELYYIYL